MNIIINSNNEPINWRKTCDLNPKLRFYFTITSIFTDGDIFPIANSRIKVIKQKRINFFDIGVIKMCISFELLVHKYSN
jgi:hypothetical protein